MKTALSIFYLTFSRSQFVYGGIATLENRTRILAIHIRWASYTTADLNPEATLTADRGGGVNFEPRSVAYGKPGLRSPKPPAVKILIFGPASGISRALIVESCLLFFFQLVTSKCQVPGSRLFTSTVFVPDANFQASNTKVWKKLSVFFSKTAIEIDRNSLQN